MLEPISRDQLRSTLGLPSDDGNVAMRALADLIRSPLSRWGLSPQSAILQYVRDQLKAAGIVHHTSPSPARVLTNLVRLGECARVSIRHEKYIAPAPPKWIRTGRESAALLSVSPRPEGVSKRVVESNGEDIVRRIWVRGDEDIAALRVAGIQESSIEDWLQPHEYLIYASQRKGRPVRDDELSVAKYWELLVSDVGDRGLPMSADAVVRAVTGEPGGYFGRASAATCEGRWSERIPEGVWCAYRRGYSDGHWHPIVLTVDGGQRRALDLFDHDEWRWALLGRGHSIGAHEHIERSDSKMRLKFPGPDQLVAAMDILGPRTNAWSWAVSKASPNPWGVLTELS